MPIAIQPYTPDLVPAVRAFNARLQAGGVPPALQFAEQPTPPWLPRLPGRKIYQEFFLAVDGADVRGGFILKHQPFSLAGQMEDVPFYHGPVSEGIVNRAFATVGVQMVRAALKAEPRLFALGMGGFDRPLPQMLKALGWRLEAVPFAFFVCRPSRFFRHVTALNQTPARRLAMRVASWTGGGWVGVKALQSWRASAPSASLESDVVEEFSGGAAGWVDELWERARRQYSLAAARDAETLEILYPARESRFLRLRVRRAGMTVGWAVMLDTQMRADPHFGHLRLGSIVDAWAHPDDADAVIWAARRWLSRRGVDLIVSNLSHAAWVRAMRRAGFLNGPSNFIFGASKALCDRLGPDHVAVPHLHWTRGDGDGPIHL